MKKYWFEVIIIVIFILKLWMVSVQPIYVKAYPHDDGMFVEEAASILQGDWLGTYNNRTLSKGVTAILFIAMANKIGIGYLLAQEVLYFLGCLSMIAMLQHVIRKKGMLLFCYVILLFNPISYSDAFAFVYRDGVYTALTLFFIAFSFQIFFHYKDKMRSLIIYSIAFGITLAAMYLCREETNWLLPYLILAIGIIIGFIIKDKECNKKIRRIICVIAIPAMITLLYVLIISSINYQYYGRFITNDFTSKEFKDAYGALTRIKQENYIKRVPLNEESRKKLYKISPKFQELEEYLEGEEGKGLKDRETKDYQEGYLYWAVRKGAYRLGYYQDAKTAEQFWIDLASEINELCDSRKN